jgi:ribosome-associated protein
VAKKAARKSKAVLAAGKKAGEAAVACARLADERRGSDIVVLNVEDVILVTDYFVIVSARNKRQIQTIASDARDLLRKQGYTNVRMEGFEEGSWVLIDAGSVVVHVFREDLRGYYDLELLWGDAPKLDWQAA